MNQLNAAIPCWEARLSETNPSIKRDLFCLWEQALPPATSL
jgi:hypothetical protein